MSLQNNDKSAAIARLNDELRQTLTGGRIMMTAGINALPDQTRARVLSAVCGFKGFNEDNDPHGEHDFAAFTVDEERINFKIDYYDLKMEYASDDASDPAVTVRVLTIMLASEY